MEYGQVFATPGRYRVYGRYSIPHLLYSMAFGGILPLVSLMFARSLSSTADDEAGANPEPAKAKQTIKELRAELAPAEGRLVDTKAGAMAAEQWFAAASLFSGLAYDFRQLH